MITGRFNIVLGLVAMILVAITGFALGLNRDAYFQNGYEQIAYWRSLTRVGHTHGMPFGMINILFGCLSAVQPARADSSALGQSSQPRRCVFRRARPCGGLQRVRCGPTASPCWEAPRSFLPASS